jgi:hypothetical protein
VQTYNKIPKLVNLHLATGPAGQLIVSLTTNSNGTSSIKGEAAEEFKPVESCVHTGARVCAVFLQQSLLRHVASDVHVLLLCQCVCRIKC